MRLIDADAFRIIVADAQTQCGKQMVDIDTTLGIVKEVLDEQPTVDAVKVVRCKDCRYWDDDRRCNGIENGLVREYTQEDDFCSYGERK